jgi:hypothetical protein
VPHSVPVAVENARAKRFGHELYVYPHRGAYTIRAHGPRHT